MTMPAPDFSRYTRIKFSRDGGVLTATLSNPGKKNAVDAALHRELSELFADIAADDDTRVAILTGEGDAFCAGGDVTWMKEGASGGSGPSADEGRAIVHTMLDLKKPLIAKVRGPAIGLGCTIALFCDCIFASENARFADPHVRVGLAPGDGGAVIWPALLGPVRAKEYLMTGDVIDAGEAARMGLINHCVPDSELDTAVAVFARRLADGPSQAIQAAKISVNILLKEMVAKVFDASMALEMESFRTADHREAVSAFLEKRAPKFTGH